MAISFKNDYSEGMHPRILQAFSETNLIEEDGYGLDRYCQKAKELICQKLKKPHAEVHFVTSGTQANLAVISSILRPTESVISIHTGHIAGPEAGAIESTGHKINLVQGIDGKLTVQVIEDLLEEMEGDEHMVMPKLVYLSNSTELGTIYQKKELKELSSYCKKKNLFLFLDGARLGTALTAKNNDLTFSEIAELVDVFYIGGIKNGGMLGEAIVLIHPAFQRNFRNHLKQKGGLVSKARFLGLQFVELFKNDLYWELARHANAMAYQIADEMERLGYSFWVKPETNLLFPILPKSVIQPLSKKYHFYEWQKIDAHQSAIRLVTSWATQPEKVEKFLFDLRQMR